MAAFAEAPMTSDRTAVGLNPDGESMPREQIEALHVQRVQARLRNAWEHVPWQRERLGAAGLSDPRELKSLADLQRLPFMAKSDLRDHFPFGLFARPVAGLARLHASSGTTGKPTVVGYTRADLDTWAELMARTLHCAGARAGDVIHNAYGYGLFTGGLGAHYGAERLGGVVVPVSGGSTERQVALIVDFGARVLCATPSYALAIAEVAEQQGVDLRKSALRVGVFGAEPWSETMRREIESRLGLQAIDNYGLSEVMGPGVAVECPQQDGMHGWEDHFLFEVIDPGTLAPVPEGQVGELVITTLTKQALPMLRYRTRDMTRLSKAPCACGRTHLRMLRVAGRSDDMLIVRGVNVYPSQIEAVLVGRPGIAPHYQVVLERHGALDQVRLEVEALPAVAQADYARLAADAAHHIKSLIGISAEVCLLAPGSVERSQGKAVRVRDLRAKFARTP